MKRVVLSFFPKSQQNGLYTVEGQNCIFTKIKFAALVLRDHLQYENQITSDCKKYKLKKESLQIRVNLQHRSNFSR
jgi:hypothetical protein